jgi:hypothetical protein
MVRHGIRPPSIGPVSTLALLLLLPAARAVGGDELSEIQQAVARHPANEYHR